MNSIKNNKLVLIVLLFAVLAEYFHLLFIGDVHSYYMRNEINTPLYWSDMVYFFLNESFTLMLVAIAYTKIGIDSGTKAIMAGVCTWFFIEWLEITLQLLKINDSRLYINDGSIIQLFTCLMISLFVLFGKKN